MQRKKLEGMPGGNGVLHWRPRPGWAVAVCGGLIVCALPSKVSAQPWYCTPGLNCVDLEWRPANQMAVLGGEVEIGLYAVADGTGQYSIPAINIIPNWDPLVLELLANQDPCDDLDACYVCPEEDPPDVPTTYNWVSSGFPYDCGAGRAQRALCRSSIQ